MEAEAEAVIFFIVEAEAEAMEKSNASATLFKTYNLRNSNFKIIDHREKKIISSRQRRR